MLEWPYTVKFSDSVAPIRSRIRAVEDRVRVY